MNTFQATVAVLASWASLVGCASAPPMETLCELDERPGNPAVTADGRLLLSMHPIDEPVFKVVELTADGDLRPFPNVSWAREGLAAVIGIEATRDGRVWMLDMGSDLVQPKVVVWDTRRDRLDRSLPIPRDVLRSGSFLQDLAVDIDRDVVIIADMDRGDPADGPSGEEARPAFIVVDVASGTARRVLENHPALRSTEPQMTIDGRVVPVQDPDHESNGLRHAALRLGLNPISLDPVGQWVYFGALTGKRLWRVPSAALADATLPEADLAASIEDRGPKGISDGILAASGGRVFVTDLEGSAIGLSDGRTYELVAQDDALLSWPDGLAFAPDGALIATVNQLHRHPSFNGGLERSSRPFRVIRFRDLRRDAKRRRFATSAEEAYSGRRTTGTNGAPAPRTRRR